MADPGQGGSKLPYNDKIDKDTWDSDTQTIDQSNRDFDKQDIPDITFTPAEV